eukprot:GILK01003386.1.p1 GENE.GILK01003386.1~~GILK01003386.1.p1  ORF type:complete len:854 (+),score=181.94 GILK01003386.1:55-2562(+)
MEIARVRLRLLLLSVFTLSFVSVCVQAHVSYIPSKGWETCLRPQENVGEGVVMCQRLQKFVSKDEYWNKDLIDIPEHDASLKFLCTHNPSADDILRRIDKRVRVSHSRQVEMDDDCKTLNEGVVYPNCNAETIWKYQAALETLAAMNTIFAPVMAEEGSVFTNNPACNSICHKVTHAVDAAIRRAHTGGYNLDSMKTRFTSLDCNQVMAGSLAHSYWLEKEDSEDASLTFENVLTGAKQSDVPMIGQVFSFPATVKRLQTCTVVATHLLDQLMDRILMDPIRKHDAVTFTRELLFEESVDCDALEANLQAEIAVGSQVRSNAGWKDRCNHVATALKRFYDFNEEAWSSLDSNLIILRDVQSDKVRHQIAVQDILVDRCRQLFDVIRGGVSPRNTIPLRRKCSQNYMQICANLKQQFRVTDVQAQLPAAASENPFFCRHPKDDACEQDCQSVATAMASTLQPLSTAITAHAFRTSEYYRAVSVIDCNRIQNYFEERTWEEHEELLDGELSTYYYNRASHNRQSNRPNTPAPLLFQKCKLPAPVICNQIADLFQSISYEQDGSNSGSCDMRLLKIGLGARGLDDPSCFDRCQLLNNHYSWQEDILRRLPAKPKTETEEEKENIRKLKAEISRLESKRDATWSMRKAKIQEYNQRIRAKEDEIKSLQLQAIGASVQHEYLRIGGNMMDSRRVQATEFKKKFCNLQENGLPAAPVAAVSDISDISVRSSEHSTIPGLGSLASSMTTDSEYSGLESVQDESAAFESPPSYSQVLKTPPGSLVSTTEDSSEAPSRFDSSVESSLDSSVDETGGSVKKSIPPPPDLVTPPMNDHTVLKRFFE